MCHSDQQNIYDSITGAISAQKMNLARIRASSAALFGVASCRVAPEQTTTIKAYGNRWQLCAAGAVALQATRHHNFQATSIYGRCMAQLPGTYRHWPVYAPPNRSICQAEQSKITCCNTTDGMEQQQQQQQQQLQQHFNKPCKKQQQH
jgi:hypothetical protein